LAPSFDGGDDFIGVGRPDKGLGIAVGLFDEAVDRALELDDGAEDAAFEPPAGEFREEALDGIEPRRRGRREVKDETGMPGEPVHHLRMLVGGVVVEDEVDDLPTGTCASRALRKRMNS
jgi:hypothetical protein